MNKKLMVWMMAAGLVLGISAPVLAGEDATPAPADRHWYDKIELDWTVVGVYQGTSGVRPALSAGKNDADANALMKMDFNFPVTAHSSVGGQVKASGGNGLDGTIPTLSGLNATGDPDQNLRLRKFWYEQNCFNDAVRINVGKLDMTQDFDCNTLANDEDAQFLSGAFVNNLAIEFPGNGAAVTGWVTPTEWLAVGAGIADADGDWDNPFDHSFMIAEAVVTANFGGRAGHYRVDFWQNRQYHTDWADQTNTRNRNSGIGVSCDQQLSEIVSVFARYGCQRSRVARVKSAYSAGAQFNCRPFGRANDVIGVAYGVAALGNPYKDFARTTGALQNPGSEAHIEAYYSCQANEYLAIAPDIQWVSHANGERNNKSIWTYGARALLTF